MQATSLITWHDARLNPPDEDILVLIAEDDGEVSTGFLDGEEWRYASAELVVGEVTHWADLPEAPTN